MLWKILSLRILFSFIRDKEAEREIHEEKRQKKLYIPYQRSAKIYLKREKDRERERGQERER